MDFSPTGPIPRDRIHRGQECNAREKRHVTTSSTLTVCPLVDDVEGDVSAKQDDR